MSLIHDSWYSIFDKTYDKNLLDTAIVDQYVVMMTPRHLFVVQIIHTIHQNSVHTNMQSSKAIMSSLCNVLAVMGDKCQYKTIWPIHNCKLKLNSIYSFMAVYQRRNVRNVWSFNSKWQTIWCVVVFDSYCVYITLIRKYIDLNPYSLYFFNLWIY